MEWQLSDDSRIFYIYTNLVFLCLEMKCLFIVHIPQMFIPHNGQEISYLSILVVTVLGEGLGFPSPSFALLELLSGVLSVSPAISSAAV